MRALLPSLILVLFTLGCTETIYEEIIKTDTVFISKPQTLAPTIITITDTVKIIDTLEVRVIIREVDTVFQIVTKDSLIIKEVEKIVTILDTIIQNQVDTVFLTDTVTVTVYDRTVIYQDTVYLIGGYIRPTTSIPLELIDILLEYGQEAEQHGKTAPGAQMIIQYMPQNELPGEDWNSFSFDFSNQWVIYLNVNVPTEQQRAGMFRELTHLHLSKQYSNDPSRLMSPLFPPASQITEAHLNKLFE